MLNKGQSQASIGTWLEALHMTWLGEPSDAFIWSLQRNRDEEGTG